MATTTNYGWTTPDDTALVKDGAAAIRTLGSSVDTTTKNLNPETTLGDIAYRSSTANVKTRLGLGTAGQVLQVNSGATAPEWATPAAVGSYALLSTTTLSGTETSVTGISGSYQDLFIEVYGVTFSTSNFSPTLGLNSGGTFRYARLGNNYLTSDTTTQELNDQETNWLRTSADNYLSFSIQNYTTTDRYKSFQVYGGYTNASSVATKYDHVGVYTSNSAITSVQFAIAGGRTLSSGTIKVWGIK
jgi:hypothetical protein